MNFYKLRLTNKVSIIILLILCNMFFHFIPFERMSIAPDNYAYLVMTRTNKSTGILYYLLNFTYRPLNHYIIDLQGRLAGDNPQIGLWLVFLSSLFVLFMIMFIFKELFNDNLLALIASFIFCLLPNKLETYHNTIFFNINMVIGIYMASFFFFLLFTKKHTWTFFYLSLLTYTIGVFWYEVGFFMPIILVAYSLLMGKRSYAKYVLYFLIPSVVYLLLRLTGVFGLSHVRPPHAIGLSGFFVSLSDLFHQYLGRYLIRNILYGFYKFLSIEQPWLIFVIISDIIFILIINILTKDLQLRKINNRLLAFSGIIFTVFLIPYFLNSQGGVGGRHLVLPSIGIVIFILWVLKLTGRKWRFILMIFFVLTIIIDQGNAWIQVLACRINSAIYDVIKEKKEELAKADNIIIDTRSFADKIPFTFVQHDFNILNTYYGAQAFEDRGFDNMVKLATNDYQKNVYIATESPRLEGDKLLEFTVSEKTGYRAVSKKTIILPQDRTVIINFNEVYPKGFYNGLRKDNGQK